MKKLTAADAAGGHGFGHSVSISEDTVVVGAQGNDDAGSDSGSAYVFERNTGGADNWGQVQKLTAADAAADDYFGFSVSISGDTVVVGTYSDNDAGTESGSAYVFERNLGGADNWGQVKKLTAADAAAGDWFGYSVSIGRDTVVVGAYQDDDAGSLSGSAYVFERNVGGADNWGQVKKLTAADAAVGNSFGFSVSVGGDTVVVGAYIDDDAGSGSGSAYVFERNTGGADDWGQVQKLTAADAAAQDRFGFFVSISGDTVVVGAYLDDDGGTESGSAYVFNFTCPVCGDELLEIPEECDDGAGNSDVTPDACRTDCTLAGCGDGVTDTGEGCDDAGESASCDANCTVAVCGDGTLNVSAGEVCDDGNTADGDACPADCGMFPPQVIAVLPEDNALDVPVGTNVTVLFSKPVHPATVTTSTFRLLDPSGTAVTASVGLAPDGKTATLDPNPNPDGKLSLSTVYTVDVTSGVQDVVGTPAVPFTSRFDTTPAGAGIPLPEVSDQSVLPSPPSLLFGAAPGAPTGTVGENLGYSVASAGDVNNDGLGDFISGAPGYTPGAQTEAGGVAVFLGSLVSAQRIQPEIIFKGQAAHDRAGSSVASGFDFNGDGLEDFLIGAEQVDRTEEPPVVTGAGKVYLIFFKPLEYDRAPVDGVPDYLVSPEMFVSLAEVGVTISGMVFTGVSSGDQAGYAVAGGGQLESGDLRDDIVIGAPGASGDDGRVYVVFSNPALCGGAFGNPAFCGVKSLGNVGGTVSGRVYQGQSLTAERLGTSVALPGDVTGTDTAGPDPDIAMGAPLADTAQSDAGKVYVAAGGSLTPGIVDAFSSIPTQVHGDQAGEQLGFAVAGGGDNRADGNPALEGGDVDLLIGAPYHDALLSNTGRVVQTSGRLPASTIPVSQVGSTLAGIVWRGTLAGGHLGWSVARLGDMSGNGLEDIGLGAPNANPGMSDAGAVYVIEGSANVGLLGTVDADKVGQTVSGGIFLGTQESERAGLVTAVAGDLDGDTARAPNDFTVGSPGWDEDLGTVHQVLGSILQQPGECSALGCTVADLTTGALLEVPAGALAAKYRFAVHGHAEATACSSAPPGMTLVGTSDNLRIDCPSPPCTPLPELAIGPDIEVPARAEVEYQLVDAEALELRYCHPTLDWLQLTSGLPQTGVVKPNEFVAGRKAVRAEGVDKLRLYGVFFQDVDGDDVRTSCDCAPSDATIWDRPGPVGNLLLSRVTGTTLTWTAPVFPGGTVVRYDTVRSTNRTDFVTGAFCVEGDETNTSAVDGSNPTPGQVFYYIIVPQNNCPSDAPCFDPGSQPAALECTSQ